MDIYEELDRKMSGGIKNNQYRNFFLACPEAYDSPVCSWEEFRQRLIAMKVKIPIPETAPTYISEFINEDEIFFPELQDEVALVVNEVYCPPFLHRLAFAKIMFVLRGSCKFLINNETIELKEGNFCIVGPNVYQAVYSCSDEDIVVNLIMRYRTFAESFLDMMDEQGINNKFLCRMIYSKTDNGAIVYSGAKDNVLTDIIEELCTEICIKKKKSNLIRKCLLTAFYGNALRLHGTDMILLDKKRSTKNYYLPEILKYMRNNLDTTLPKLCDYFDLSEGYISRYISNETGRTFRELLREMRMKRAAEMLEHTSFTLDKIIESVGYTEKSRFFKNFKEIYGITPIKYRERRFLL